MWPRIVLGAIGVFAWKLGSGFFTRVWLLLRQLWHEVIGFLFLALAFAGASTMLREWRSGTNSRLLLAAGFTVMMAYFGLTSFRSARKVRPPDQTQQSRTP